MKEKLEVVTNIVLISLACVIGYHFLQARRTPENPSPASVKVGDQLPSLPAYDWKAHDRTLVLALRNGCRFCEESIPFYRKLAELEKSNQIDAHLIAVFPDDPGAVRQLVEAQRLAVEALPGIELSQVKVEGTPTLILVDRQGRVSKIWIGELAAAGQADVVAAISQAGANRPWSAAAELPPSLRASLLAAFTARVHGTWLWDEVRLFEIPSQVRRQRKTRAPAAPTNWTMHEGGESLGDSANSTLLKLGCQRASTDATSKAKRRQHEKQGGENDELAFKTQTGGSCASRCCCIAFCPCATRVSFQLSTIARV